MHRRTPQLWLVSLGEQREWCPTWRAARQVRVAMSRAAYTPLCDVKMTAYIVPRDGTGLCRWLNVELPRIKP